MDYVVTLLLGVILALLVAIVLELRKIRSAIARIPEWSRRRGIPEARPTVTVNVGAVAPAEGVPVTLGTPSSEAAPQPGADPEPEAEPLPEIETAPAPPVHFPPKRSGGITAVKCPHCGSENSSFRTECFQCGKRL